MPKKPKDQSLTPATGELSITGFAPIVSRTDDYAENWYQDALSEVGSRGHDARRREIIFATCFAESFIYEWARDKVGHVEIDKHFPYESARGRPTTLIEKWKKVPTVLYKLGKVKTKTCPTLKVSGLGTLIRHRNELIHATASQPAINPHLLHKKRKPFPTRKALNLLPAGWAVSIVFDLVSELYNQTGDSNRPAYLKSPQRGTRKKRP